MARYPRRAGLARARPAARIPRQPAYLGSLHAALRLVRTGMAVRIPRQSARCRPALPGRGRAAPSTVRVIDLGRDHSWCGLRQGGPAEVAHHVRDGGWFRTFAVDGRGWVMKVGRGGPGRCAGAACEGPAARVQGAFARRRGARAASKRSIGDSKARGAVGRGVQPWAAGQRCCRRDGRSARGGGRVRAGQDARRGVSRWRGRVGARSGRSGGAPQGAEKGRARGRCRTARKCVSVGFRGHRKISLAFGALSYVRFVRDD